MNKVVTFANTFRFATTAGILLFAATSCPPTQPPGGIANPILPALFDTEVPPFAVIVSADRSTGIPGTVFKLSAEVSGNSSAIRSYSWKANNGNPSSVEGQSPDFIFSQPGDFNIDVVVEDEQGATVTDGILIKVFDPAAQPPAAVSQITPAAGMPGTFVQIRSADLNDSAARIEVTVGDGTPFEPFRPELGTANFLIPLDAADGITEATTVQITLLADGQTKESFNFVLSPAPALTDVPGTLVHRWLETGSHLLDGAEGNLVAAIPALDAGLGPEEQAMLQALLRFASGRFAQVGGVLKPTLDHLDSESLAAFDRVLIANGVNTSLLDNISLQAKRAVANKNANDDLIDLLCKFHDVMKAIQDFINAAGHASTVLPLLALETAGSAITPTIVALADIISELDIVADVLKEIDELVPHVESLEVTATPGALKTESEKAVIHVNAKLTLQNDICRDAVDKLIDEISSRSIQRLIQLVPLPRLARIVVRHSFVLGDSGIQSLHEMQDFLRSAMNKIAGLIISAGQLDGILAQIHVKLCAIEQRDSLPLQPADPTIIMTSPPTAGTFLNLQEESLDFYCRLGTQGQVSIKAERECGLADASGSVHKLSGEAHVTCFAELCTENALGSLTINPVTQPNNPSPSSCGFVKEQLDYQLVDVFFTNTHESRTIALATVSILESDKRTLPRGPCEDPQAFGGSVIDCLDHATAGCDSPPSLFLAPGQTTTIPATFVCRREELYPPEGGKCGDLELETIKGHLLVQAVFCDDLETAKQNFCRNVDQQMKLLGFPAPEFPSTEVRPCP